jgi:hypothetical protein
MADFRQKKRFSSKLPQLTVAAGLPPGRYVFQLEVEDQSGNKSRPARVQINIVASIDTPGTGGSGPIVVTPITHGPIVQPLPPLG